VFVQLRPSINVLSQTSIHCSSPLMHRILQIICCVKTLLLMFHIVTKLWGMGQHHVLGWWEHYCWAKAQVSTTKKHIILWADLYEFMIFMMIPSSDYSAIVIEYNSYQEFKFRLHYIKDTSKSI
jgi:hypothetical protein